MGPEGGRSYAAAGPGAGTSRQPCQRRRLPAVPILRFHGRTRQEIQISRTVGTCPIANFNLPDNMLLPPCSIVIGKKHKRQKRRTDNAKIFA